MPLIVGTVDEIEVYPDYAYVKIDTGSGTSYNAIWSDYVEDYSPTHRIIHGMWLTLLRDSLVNKLEVSVYTDDAIVQSVVLNA